MSFTLTIMNGENDMDKILATGFIQCCVSLDNSPEHVYEYVYCVHCRRLHSLSWMFKHAKTTPFVLTPRLADLLTQSMHLFENDIRTEVELIWDRGKLFARRLVAPVATLPASGSSSSQTVNAPESSTLSHPNGYTDDDVSDSVGLNDGGTEASFVDERTFGCVEALIVEHCFPGKRFDSCRFSELMERLRCFDAVKRVFSKKQAPFLARLITSVMRTVFVSLSMTRSQIDTISRLFKCVLLLLSDDHNEIARRIHSNYSSCVRDAWAKGEEKDVFVESCFQRCKCFSIALDTALFGQEHIMSCTVRFVFETDIMQFPLFMALCYASSGEEMASFLLSKLTEKNAVISKLTSVTTDGASSMIGNDRGLFACLCRLLKASGTIEADKVDSIRNVWCFAHRMNLVTRDMKEEPTMRDVFCLADWMTSRRVAVSYRKFLKIRWPDARFPKVQTPSETRWVFYRDVVGVILAQFDQIVIFISQGDELPTTLSHSQTGSMWFNPKSDLLRRRHFQEPRSSGEAHL